MELRTVVGRVELQVCHGKDPGDGHWGCPIREQWGLSAHQQMSPTLEQKLAFTATMTDSYEKAARMSANWNCPIEASVIHALVLDEIATLKVVRGERGKIVCREKKYLAEQAGRMNYKELADRGWPIGSGAVESQCNQSQGRCKRSGQFWTSTGFRHLCALDEARHNGHWDEIWTTA